VFLTPKPRAALLAVAAALALSACGRRGDLEPPSANVVQTPVNKHDIEFHRPSQKIAPPKKDFVLDPLLQ
jgi:predicted small lipoprotein YifL